MRDAKFFANFYSCELRNFKGLEAEKIISALFLNVEKAAKKQSTKTMRNSIRHSIATPSIGKKLFASHLATLSAGGLFKRRLTDAASGESPCRKANALLLTEGEMSYRAGAQLQSSCELRSTRSRSTRGSGAGTAANRARV
jgi:hypothetical protein